MNFSLKPNNANTTKPFWKKLSFIAFSTVAVISGIVWASSYNLDKCSIIEVGFGEVSKACLRSSKKKVDENGVITETNIRNFNIPQNNDTVGVTGYDETTEVGKQLKFINNSDSDKDVLIPARSRAELVSFLKAIKNAGSGNPLAKISVCSPDGAITIGTENVAGCVGGNQWACATQTTPESCSGTTNVGGTCTGSYITEVLGNPFKVDPFGQPFEWTSDRFYHQNTATNTFESTDGLPVYPNCNTIYSIEQENDMPVWKKVNYVSSGIGDCDIDTNQFSTKSPAIFYETVENIVLCSKNSFLNDANRCNAQAGCTYQPVNCNTLGKLACQSSAGCTFTAAEFNESVVCKDANGTIVADNNCSLPKATTTDVCTNNFPVCGVATVNQNLDPKANCLVGTGTGIYVNTSNQQVNALTRTETLNFNWQCSNNGNTISCSDAYCDIDHVSGQSCTAKAGMVNYTVDSGKRWIDGSAFNWSNILLNKDNHHLYGSRASGSGTYIFHQSVSLWTTASNTSRITCNSGNKDKYAYVPYLNGNWKKVQCKQTKSDFSCWFGACGLEWQETTRGSNEGPTSVYNVVSNGVTQSQDAGFSEQCTKDYYEYSGEYERACTAAETTGTTPELDDIIVNEPTSACYTSCSVYNRWVEQGENPPIIDGCSAPQKTATRPSVCYRSCASEDNNTCSSAFGGNKCEVSTNNYTRKDYGDKCTFKYVTGDWGKDYSGNVSSMYSCRVINQSSSPQAVETRTVGCKAYPHDNESVNPSYCDNQGLIRPNSSRSCTAYYWKYKGAGTCDAVCSLLEIAEAEPKTIKDLLIGSVHAQKNVAIGETCEPGSSTYTVHGTKNDKEYQCVQVNDTTSTNVADAECTSRGIAKPFTTSQSCTRTCQCPT